MKNLFSPPTAPRIRISPFIYAGVTRLGDKFRRVGVKKIFSISNPGTSPSDRNFPSPRNRMIPISTPGTRDSPRGQVPMLAAGTVPAWSLPSPLRDRNVASPLLRNCGVWWAILYLTRRGRHVYGVVRSFYHRCFNRFQMSELEIDLEPFAVHFALTGSGDSPPCGHFPSASREDLSMGGES